MTAADWRLPAEWEPQSGILLAWPHAGTDWAERLEAVERCYLALVAAILRFESCVIGVGDAEVGARAQQLLTAAALTGPRLKLLELPYNDTWLRDSGPLTLVGTEGYKLLDFRFTGWGGKFEASADDRIIERCIERKLFLNNVHQRIDFALEGGAIDVDGAGTMLTTWRCLHERHPERSRAEIERVLIDAFALDRVLWLDHGYLQGDDTDAHVDTLARFAAEDAIVYQGCSDRSDLHFDELAAMAAELAALRTQDGTPYRLFELPWAQPVFDGERRLAASYANFLIVNGAVLMPAYDDPADARAADVLAAAFPQREILPVPCRDLIWQNGSLHCLSMQLPRGLIGG